MSDRKAFKALIKGYVDSNPDSITDTKQAVADASSHTYTWRKDAADTNAGDNTAEFVVFGNPRAGSVRRVYYVADANVAVQTNDTILLTAKVHTAADPANAVIVANGIMTSGGIGGMTRWVPKDITLVPANATLAANSVVTFLVTKANSGTALAAGVLHVDVEEGTT